VPDGKGGLAGAVLGLGEGDDPFVAGALARKLPAGDWYFEAPLKTVCGLRASVSCSAPTASRATASPSGETPRLVLDASLDRARIAALAEAVWLARDLVNTPANDLGPDGIETAARALAAPREMTVKVTKGADLLKQNFR
jgi:leucyl aminopeptidase